MRGLLSAGDGQEVVCYKSGLLATPDEFQFTLNSFLLYSHNDNSLSGENEDMSLTHKPVDLNSLNEG